MVGVEGNRWGDKIGVVMDVQKVVGKVYGRLKIKKLIPPNKSKTGRTRCICDCACGTKEIEKELAALRFGGVQSCGCLAKEHRERADIKRSMSQKAAEGEKFASLTSPGEYKKYVL